MLKTELLKIGLTKNEVEVYLFILKNGVSSSVQIAKGTHIQRTNIYHLLDQLKALSLIREDRLSSNKKVYIASDPESLYRSLEEKRQVVAEILPDLRALHITQKNKPTIQFFDGLEQIKEVYLKTLDSKEVFAIGSTKSLNQRMPKFFKKWISKVKDRKIIFNDILTGASKVEAGPIMKDILKGYYDVSYLPDKYNDLSTDILIWDDNIALISLEEPFFATMLTNPLLADTMRIVFSVMRDGLNQE